MTRSGADGVHGSLVDQLGEAIVHGRHPAGFRLITAEIGEQNGASRSAAREAVRVLESLGLVRVRRKAGVEVLPAAEWNVYAPEVIAWSLSGPGRADQLRALGQLRAAVEPLAASLAAASATDEQRGSLLAAVRQMSRLEGDANGPEYLDADIRFHRTLLDGSANPMLAALGDVVESVLRGRTRHDLMPHEANHAAVGWHQDVAFAVAGGRADAAQAAMRLIVNEADEAVRAAIDPGPAE